MKRMLVIGLSALAGSLVTLALVNEDVEVITNDRVEYVTTIERVPVPYEVKVEVPVPVEVIKEVEVEVIKEVVTPVEVEVEVVKEVPAQVFNPLTNEYTTDAQAALDSAYAQLEQVPACVNEDGSGGPLPCFWSAATRGNGEGRSFFIDEVGTAHYVG